MSPALRERRHRFDGLEIAFRIGHEATPDRRGRYGRLTPQIDARIFTPLLDGLERGRGREAFVLPMPARASGDADVGAITGRRTFDAGRQLALHEPSISE